MKENFLEKHPKIDRAVDFMVGMMLGTLSRLDSRIVDRMVQKVKTYESFFERHPRYIDDAKRFMRSVDRNLVDQAVQTGQGNRQREEAFLASLGGRQYV